MTIQTYNRAGVLAATLESLRDLRCPRGADYEILVVNNNCSDHTHDVIQKYAQVLAPRLRETFELHQGLSHARNRALREARGEIVCFIDDDVQVEAGWLEAVAAAFVRYDAALVGGKSYLIFPGPKPAWVDEAHERLLSKLDYGDQPLVGTTRELFGLNYSVRKGMALQVGGFDPRLGRVGGRLTSGEEEDLQQRLQHAGGIVVYEPKAVVGHRVLPERLKLTWFFRRYFRAGAAAERTLMEQGAALDTPGRMVQMTARCFLGIVKRWFLLDFSLKAFMDRARHGAFHLGRLCERARAGRGRRAARASASARIGKGTFEFLLF